MIKLKMLLWLCSFIVSTGLQLVLADSPTNTASTATNASINQTLTPEMQRQFDAIYNQPINFWGKIVDEKGMPVANAQVKYEIADSTSDPEHLPEHYTTSDAQGDFSILRQKGSTLFIFVAKEGYYFVASDNSNDALGSSGHFTFGGRGLHDRQLPTSTSPITFLLHQKGTPASTLVLTEKKGNVPGDGTSTPFYLDPADILKSGYGDLQIKAVVNAPASTPLNPNRQPFDWNATISVVGGGLVPGSNRLDFRAPDSGYQPSDQIGFQKSDPHWRSSVERFYFIKLPNGHYCRVGLVFYASEKSLVSIRCYYNQIEGDHNLESKTGSNPAF
jgi:hypothetical protein